MNQRDKDDCKDEYLNLPNYLKRNRRRHTHCQCPTCSKKFISQDYLSNHIRNVHPIPSKEFCCKTCNRYHRVFCLTYFIFFFVVKFIMDKYLLKSGQSDSKKRKSQESHEQTEITVCKLILSSPIKISRLNK